MKRLGMVLSIQCDDDFNLSLGSETMKGLPKTGLYVSTRKVDGLRLVVEDVYGPEDKDFVDELNFVRTIKYLDHKYLIIGVI